MTNISADSIKDNQGRIWTGGKFPDPYGRRWTCATLPGAVIRHETGALYSIPGTGAGGNDPEEGSFDALARRHAGWLQHNRPAIGQPSTTTDFGGGQEVW